MIEITPIPGESFLGLVARFAADSGFDRMINVTGEVGCLYGDTQVTVVDQDADLATLASMMGCEEAELASRQHLLAGPMHRDFFGVPIHRFHFELIRRRFARGSLARSPYHRAMWMLRPLTFCTESWELLEMRCPDCGAEQKWGTTVGVSHCSRCAADLAHGPVEHVPERLRPDLRHVADLLHFDPVRRAAATALLPEALRPYDGGALVEVMLRVAHHLQPDVRLHWQDVTRELAREVNEKLAIAWRMLVGWPASVVEHLHRSAHEQRKDGRHREVDTRVGLFRADRNVGRSAGAAAVLQMARDEIDVFGVKEPELRSRTMGINEASYVLALSSAEMAALRDDGAFRTHVVYNGRRGVCINFDRREIADIRAMRRDRASLDKVGENLGLPDYAVEQLIALGELEAFAHPYMVKRFKGRQLRLSTLELLRCDVIERADRPGCEGARPLRAIMQGYGGGLKPWGRLLAALRRGDMPCTMAPEKAGWTRSGTPRLVDLVALAPDDEETVYSWKTAVADYPAGTFAPGVDKRDAGEILNIGYYAEGGNLFPPCGRPGPNQKLLVATMEQIEGLARARIGSKEIARRAKIPFQTVKGKVRELGFIRIDEAGFNRAVVEAWLDSLD